MQWTLAVAATLVDAMDSSHRSHSRRCMDSNHRSHSCQLPNAALKPPSSALRPPNPVHWHCSLASLTFDHVSTDLAFYSCILPSFRVSFHPSIACFHPSNEHKRTIHYINPSFLFLPIHCSRPICTSALVILIDVIPPIDGCFRSPTQRFLWCGPILFATIA